MSRAVLARAMTEKELQRSVLELAAVAGWCVYHTFDSRRSQPGFPDVVLVHPRRRRLLFAELKSAKGALRPDQRAWLWHLASAGQSVHVWLPAQWLDGTVERVLTCP